MTREAKILIAIMVVVVGGGLFAAFSSGPPANPSEVLIREDSRKMGRGKVQLVEFGDYQCPGCGQAHPITKKLMEEYEGKVTFVYRHFPLPSHRNARPAAQAAEAAAAQGKFWEMHDKLYESQGEWSEVLDPISIFTRYAKGLGLDESKFKQEVEAKKYSKVIMQGVDDGYDAGVQSTPTFFVNGKKQRAFDYDSLKSAIEAELR